MILVEKDFLAFYTYRPSSMGAFLAALKDTTTARSIVGNIGNPEGHHRNPEEIDTVLGKYWKGTLGICAIFLCCQPCWDLV